MIYLQGRSLVFKWTQVSYLNYIIYNIVYYIIFDHIFSYLIHTEYRKEWDSLIVKLNILDKQKLNEQINLNKPLNDIQFFDTGNEVLQWVMKYPASYLVYLNYLNYLNSNS